MFQLRCIVRDCHELLRLEDSRKQEMFCGSGHHFDRAKQGYWPLLQPQDRKSLNAGDSDEAVFARQRWLQRGHAAGLIESLRPWMTIHPHGSSTLDLGCGEGSFGPALFPDEAESYCGIDLSKRAIKLAARGWPAATWVMANADRILPASDGSVHRVLSLFGRRPAVEIKRVLAPEGICVVAIPGEDDLIELREKVQQAGHQRSRWEAVVDEMRVVGLELVERKEWKHQVELEQDAINDALAMTYRAVRHSQRTRSEDLSSMQVTLAADLLMFRSK